MRLIGIFGAVTTSIEELLGKDDYLKIYRES